MLRMPEPIAETSDAVTHRRSDIGELAGAIDGLEARAAFAATRGEETFPAAVVRRLCAGVSPVRVLRQHRGPSAAAVARQAGVSPSYLSEIGHGRKPGSTRALRDLAQALRVDIDELLP
jgi:hypothetical protein